MDESERVLSEIYYNEESPGGFGGVNRLFAEAKKVIPALSLETVKKWLQSQSAYTLFKPARKKFKRLRILVSNIDEQWEADLMDMSWLQSTNSGVKYLLAVIDVFSKYAWVIPLKNKSANSLIEAINTIFKQGRIPKKLRTDQGKEFKDETFQKLMRDNNINFFTTTDDTVKAAVVERFNRTLRERIYRYLYHKNSNTYIDALSGIVKSYNKSYHRTIGMSPESVASESVPIIQHRMREKPKAPTKKKLIEGDFVRISRKKGIFEKGATNNYSEEIFKIRSLKRTPIGFVYKLSDLGDEPITSIFYRDELTQVDKPEFFNIKVLKTRKNPRTKKKELFIHWIGYPKKFDQWIDEDETKKLNNG